MTEILRDYNPDRDRASAERLFEETFSNPQGGQTLGWVFRDTPAGEAPRAVVEYEDRVVAFAGTMPVRYRAGEQDVLCGYSVCAMTSEEMRGRGLYVRLSEYLYERMKERGFGIVAGFSNAQSYRLMASRLERRAIRPFPWSIRVLNPLRMATALLQKSTSEIPPWEPVDRTIGGVHIESCTISDLRFDPLWERASSAIEVGAIRDRAFIEWRFGGHPRAQYQLLIAETERGPAAYVAYRAMRIKGIPAGFLVDLLIAPGEAAAGRALLATVRKLAHQQGTALLTALIPPRGPVREALRGAHFLQIPERLHPQIIRFSYRGFTDLPALQDPKAWFLSWADIDIV